MLEVVWCLAVREGERASRETGYEVLEGPGENNLGGGGMSRDEKV